MSTDGSTEFWSLAEAILALDGVQRGTMMGHPCLRREGEFFAMVDNQSQSMIAKLSKERVIELVTDGIGQPFAPAGKVFKQWVLVPPAQHTHWASLMAEAHRFAGS